MSLRVSRGDLTALSGAFSQISAGVSKIASLSRVPRRCICGHMWTLNSLLKTVTKCCFINFRNSFYIQIVLDYLLNIRITKFV